MCDEILLEILGHSLKEVPVKFVNIALGTEGISKETSDCIFAKNSNQAIYQTISKKNYTGSDI